MANQELINYIQKSRQAGVSDIEIRQSLISSGWKTTNIDEGFNPAPVIPVPAPDPSNVAPNPQVSIDTLNAVSDVIVLSRTQKLFRSIWFWWIFLSVIYIVLYISGILPESSYRASVVFPYNHIAAFIGLFVPYGLASSWLFVFAPIQSIISAILFGMMMVTSSKYIRRTKSTIVAIALCLISLLIITTVVDFVRMTPFASWRILMEGYLNLNP